jgi:glutamyl-tRNA(Gln) amidotransferase subunit E
MAFEDFSDNFYKDLGFKCGLEVHQQLDTEKKLFCNCPVGLRKEDPDGRILRHMRPTLSELGEYDGTALMEFKTRKDVIYELYSSCTCTYEMDDTPPFPINKDAIEYAIEIALLFNCKIVDEVHVTRKQYLDGSIPTGFQRTAIIGVDGSIPYQDRQVPISLLTLEEDACREVSDNGHVITFKTDRLSTPLVEVITAPVMKTPREVMEVNWLIARVLRASGKVRRGIGSVRQDVNVSINGGERVEIKGVPRIGLIGPLTHNEALRQAALLKAKAFLADRQVTEKSLNTQEIWLAPLLDSLTSPLFANYKRKEVVFGALKIDKIQGLFSLALQPGRVFADEVSGRLRVIACLDQLPNMTHSEEAPGPFILEKDWDFLKKKTGVGKEDLLVITWGPEQDVRTALKEIRLRIVDAVHGVPNETRQVMPGGVTDFERILPGPDRMYPDTDSAPTVITSDQLKKIKGRLPEHPLKASARYKEMGLTELMIRNLEKLGLKKIFEAVVHADVTAPVEAANILTHQFRFMQRKGLAIRDIPKETLISLLKAFSGETLSSAAFSRALESAATDPAQKPEKILGETYEPPPGRAKIRSVIREEIERNRLAVFRSDLKKMAFITGQCRKRLPATVSGRIVAELVKSAFAAQSKS